MGADRDHGGRRKPCCGCPYRRTSLRERDLEYQAREQALEKTLAKEEARAAELEEYRVYVQTKQYIEKVAKEKLGLVNKDEILFKADESN